MTAAESSELAASLGKPARGGGRPTAYKTKDGKRVPGVTTITNRFKEAGGLIHWAWEMGRDGKDYRAARDDAASVGHLAHAMIDAEIHGSAQPMQPETMSAVDWARALSARDAFRTWADQVKLEILDTEVPLVSETWRYGGTRDCLARVNGAVTLMDWKSSNAVYREYVVQLAAYRQLAREHGVGVDAGGLIRFGKEYADFTWYAWPSDVLDVGWEAFRYQRELYDLDNKLKGIVR